MHIDKAEFSVVALCDECTWRTIRPTPARAWTALALHAKQVHNDPHAARSARDAARMSAARARRKRSPVDRD